MSKGISSNKDSQYNVHSCHLLLYESISHAGTKSLESLEACL